MTGLPPVYKPSEIAGHIGASERTIREKARELGTCRIVGNAMVLTEQDVEAFLEGIKPCPSSFTGAVTSGTTPGQLPGGDFASLQERLTKPARSASQRKPKRAHGNFTSMDRGRA